MTEFYLIGGMALVTFLIRYLPFAIAGQHEYPQGLVRALGYVPPAVLTAIVVPVVLIPGGERIVFSYTNAYLVGALIACGVGWVSRNLLLTIVMGMIAFLSWQWVLVSWLN